MSIGYDGFGSADTAVLDTRVARDREPAPSEIQREEREEEEGASTWKREPEALLLPAVALARKLGICIDEASKVALVDGSKIRASALALMN